MSMVTIALFPNERFAAQEKPTKPYWRAFAPPNNLRTLPYSYHTFPVHGYTRATVQASEFPVNFRTSSACQVNSHARALPQITHEKTFNYSTTRKITQGISKLTCIDKEEVQTSSDMRLEISQ